jgi:hypothetical protein
MMKRQKSSDPPGRKYFGTADRLLAALDEVLGSSRDPRVLFSEFSRVLESEFEIRKGFLALREGDQTHFLAVASWKQDGTRKNLSLRLPQAPSLFEKVAESGQIYSENFAELFDGNLIERQLLFDDDTVSFMLRPLKHEGRVVALLGYSSDVPDAFETIQEGTIDAAFDKLAACLGRLLPEATPISR